LGKSLNNAYLTAYYYFDTDNFIEEYCENQDKPELKCHGSCKIDKMSKSNEPVKQPSSELKLDVSSFAFTCDQPFEFAANLLQGLDQRVEILYLNTYSSTEINDVFHPPQV
jgi:hypothetical protein